MGIFPPRAPFPQWPAGRPELNHIDGLIVMDAALPVRAAGSLIGAIGVSGAPGGAALKKMEERLEFAM